MKIAYISDQFLPQTATDTEQSLNMIAGLGNRGAQVRLVVPRAPLKPGPTAEELARYYQVPANFEVQSYPMPTWPRVLAKAGHALRAVVTKLAGDADVLYTRNLPLVVSAAAAGLGPIIYETYRPWPDQNPALRVMLQQLAKSGRLAGLVLHSRLAADSFERVGFPNERLLVAHNAWDPKKLEPVLSVDAARRQCGLPQSGQVVTYAGRVQQHKGIGLILEMARALPQVRFVIVGSEGEGEMEAEAAPIANVEVRPWLPFSEVVPYLYASDVLLIPPTLGPLQTTGTTVLPMKTFLYMATGRAIFAGRTPDLLEILKDGENACLVPPDDAPAAIEGLRALLADPARGRELGAAARRKMDAWTWDDRAQAVLDFIANL